MKNSFIKKLYHWFICKRYSNLTYRGGWILTHFFYLDYKERKTSITQIAKTHLKGWSYSDWSILGVTEENQKEYLSTKQYCSLHPVNKEFSSWIDDKLILKYILNGTKAGKYMPDYYFQITEDSKIIPLMDVHQPFYHGDVESVIKLLQEKKRLAFKLIKGSLGVGFYKAEYKEGAYWLNGELFSEEMFIKTIKSLKNYIITEYLLPHAEFAKFCKNSVGCLRYLIGRKKNGELIDIYSFMRFGTSKSRFVENYNAGGVLTIINDGMYDKGNVINFDTWSNEIITHHPDNGIEIKGYIPNWDNIVEAAHTIADTMPQLTYMGIDFCITNNNNIKIIEINSLSSLDTFQLDKSIFNTKGGTFFKERLNMI